MSITLDQVTKQYQGLPVVNDVSVEVGEGEFFVLLGPSGSGKSTLLRAIAGLTGVDHGRIALHGRDVTTWAERHLAAPEWYRISVSGGETAGPALPLQEGVVLLSALTAGLDGTPDGAAARPFAVQAIAAPAVALSVEGGALIPMRAVTASPRSRNTESRRRVSI